MIPTKNTQATRGYCVLRIKFRTFEAQRAEVVVRRPKQMSLLQKAMSPSSSLNKNLIPK